MAAGGGGEAPGEGAAKRPRTAGAVEGPGGGCARAGSWAAPERAAGKNIQGLVGADLVGADLGALGGSGGGGEGSEWRGCSAGVADSDPPLGAPSPRPVLQGRKRGFFMDGWVMSDEPEPCPPPPPSCGGRAGLLQRLAPRAGAFAGADPATPPEFLATRPHGEAPPLPAAAVAGATEQQQQQQAASAAARRSLSRILAREAGRVARRAQAPPSPWTHPL